MTRPTGTSSETGARRIAVVGLGYVGLPVARAMARAFPGTVGFDIDEAKVSRLRSGDSVDGPVPEIERGLLPVTTDARALADANFYIVVVPTPVDAARRPNLEPLRRASRLVGELLKPGDIVVYESTVYPGVTEETCGPLLAERSGLRCGVDFHVAYSPERINPGDARHTFESIVKIVSAQDAATLDAVAEVYGAVVEAGIYRAPSIRVAEASKVIENIQRDLNIALINELAVIFHRLGIDTQEVLAAARTKWNFLDFRPGLVGGHCIGVDPYYLTTKAQEVGLNPEVILSGRRINDSMGTFVARQTVKELSQVGAELRGARVAVLGLAFKENVADARNSRVPDLVRELAEFGVDALVYDPLVEPAVARRDHGIELVGRDGLRELDAVVLAVAHEGAPALALELLRAPRARVLVDVKSMIDRADVPSHVRLWRL
ncbi:MAG: nucleotide sugar dehydrogenase [Myxococcales bacterium]|nr:nucleotide sugar dehydrogenase [Myxococcales bacterium]